jgi:large subunit ribosomal protein L18
MTAVARKRREGRLRRHRRVRKKVHGTAARPRLAIYRSNKHLSAQIIDDDAGRTLVSASSQEADFRKKQPGGNVAAATAIGTMVAERAKQAGITTVVFDRGGFLYHGRIAAIAEAARAAGLEF